MLNQDQSTGMNALLRRKSSHMPGGGMVELEPRTSDDLPSQVGGSNGLGTFTPGWGWVNANPGGSALEDDVAVPTNKGKKGKGVFSR